MFALLASVYSLGADDAEAPKKIKLLVAGLVRNPGSYIVSEKASIAEILKTAGGASTEAVKGKEFPASYVELWIKGKQGALRKKIVWKRDWRQKVAVHVDPKLVEAIIVRAAY
jgi:hypothetical protein